MSDSEKEIVLRAELETVTKRSRRYHQIHSALHYLRNKPMLKARHRQWRQRHPKLCKRYTQRYVARHPERRRATELKSAAKRDKAKLAEYSRVKRPIFRQLDRARDRQRRKTDVLFVIKKRLRARLANALRGYGAKAEPTLQLLGCSLPFLKRHLESRFKPGMSWKNRHRWHIDHVLPCKAFDLTQREEQLKCFHWSNLQPLWKRDNLTKRSRVVDCQPELLLAIT